MDLFTRALEFEAVRRAARGVADWVDLQYSLLLPQIARAAPRARGRLLDVGCGDKPYEQIFRPYVSDYVGIEHEGVFPSTHASAAAGRPDLYYDGNRLPFPDKSFDTVLSVQVLEHTPKPQSLLNEIARVLRPEGLLILSAPFSARLHEEPYDYFRYTPHGLRSMCEEARLEVTEMWAQGNLWSVVGHKLNSYLAFRVAAGQGVAVRMGKLKHEVNAQPPRGRPWLLPAVVPAMIVVAAGARLLDRVAPDPTEALSHMLFARPRPT
jgi:SAM-dependent methyltransferase